MIERSFRMVDLLEGLGESGPSARSGPRSPGVELGKALALLPDLMQRVIFLRHFENLNWAEIARIVGEVEVPRRRRYARAIRDLVLLCTGNRPPGS